MNPEHVTPKPTKLDYSTLAMPVTNMDIKAMQERVKSEAHKRTSRTVQILVVAFIIALLLPFTIGMIMAFIETRSPWPFFFVVLLIALVAYFIYYSKVIHPRHLVRLYRFADANRLQVVRDVTDPAYSGMIFDEGHSRQISEALRFTSGVEIGNYRYVTGSGKNRQTHDYAYAKLPLGRHLPHMVLDSLQNNFLGMTNLPDSFKEDQRLELEGDFNKHFKLYAPKQYERDALYIFTPDVMATMIDNGERYDMEIVDDTLYIYSQLPLDLLSAQRLEPLLQIVDVIGQDLSKQTARYSDERVGDRSLDSVALQGQRLKKGFNLTIILVVIAVFGVQVASSFCPEAAAVGWGIIWLFVMGTILYAVIKKVSAGFSK